MGRKHDIKEVPDGHAQNYLIPRRLAVLATSENLKQHDARRARTADTEAETAELCAAFLAQAATTPLVMRAPANAQGHLFKGLHAAEVAEALSFASGITIPVRALDIAQPIKAVGEYQVGVTLSGRHGTVPVHVIAQ